MTDILLYISDQHAWQQQGYVGDPIIRTPTLDHLAKLGTVFNNCYTTYPLCAPARMSMMSCQLPSHCGVMDNMTAMDSNLPTFAHSLNAAGYDTVLCGRMHFVGPDQRHGFSKRIAGEMTPIFHNRPEEAFRKERGIHMNTPFSGYYSLAFVGGGNSPTLEYDRYVVNSALQYLREDHNKPQFLCIGTYAPHHPYVAPKDLFEYYYEKMDVPKSTFDLEEHSQMAKETFVETDPEIARSVRAAYYGMVEFEDQKIGEVYDAFQNYLTRTGHEGIFVYVSDHGDQIGYRGHYGKSTFYDSSAKIPLLFVGTGIAQGQKIMGATSLMDIGPTFCDLAKAPPLPQCDGVSLYPQLLEESPDDFDRMVISELGGGMSPTGFRYGQMVKWGSLKYIHYENHEEEDIIYNLLDDPLETTNCIHRYPLEKAQMQAFLRKNCPSTQKLKTEAEKRQKNLLLLRKCTYDSPERWQAPKQARELPDPLFSFQKRV